jgi:acyl-CoA thioester hydrolase
MFSNFSYYQKDVAEITMLHSSKKIFSLCKEKINQVVHMNFYHTLPVQIRFNDLDPARHVNNAVYAEYFDLGKVSYFREVTGQPLNFEGLSLVVAGYRIDFFLPVFAEDQIEVKTRVHVLGNKSLELEQHLCLIGDKTPRGVSSTTMVCFNYSSRQSEFIPEAWKEKIRTFEHNECMDKQ